MLKSILIVALIMIVDFWATLLLIEHNPEIHYAIWIIITTFVVIKCFLELKILRIED